MWFDSTRQDQEGERALCGQCFDRLSRTWRVLAVRDGHCASCGWWARLFVTAVKDTRA